jgi:hypothetical protein
LSDKPPLREPSPDEYDRIARGFDAAAADTIRVARVWVGRLKWTVLVVLGLLVLMYIGEDVWLRWKNRSGPDSFGSVTVTRYLAIHKKSGKIEYDSDEPVLEKCVNSVFPHFGVRPCWYVRRHQHPIVDM